MGISDKITKLEEELSTTKKHKGTEYHIGLMKAKLARYKRESAASKKAGGGTGFDVKKSGDSTVVLIGLPSTGKSTLLNALTNAESKAASYAFTTLTCIPGIMEYQGAKIQILDLPGIIGGAKGGKGRGKEVLAVARNADLVLLIIDVFQPSAFELLKDELHGVGLRLDQTPPQIFMSKTQSGGVSIKSTVKLTKLNEKLITGILNEYGIHSGEIVFREDATEDQLIDFLDANRRYTPSLTVLNKVDLVSPDFIKHLKFPFVPVSAEKKENLENLRLQIFQRLRLIRVYTKPRLGEADMKAPMMMRSNSTIGDACDKLHRDLRNDFKYAQIWGPSAKFPGQKLGIDHVLADGDILTIVKKQG